MHLRNFQSSCGNREGVALAASRGGGSVYRRTELIRGKLGFSLPAVESVHSGKLVGKVRLTSTSFWLFPQPTSPSPLASAPGLLNKRLLYVSTEFSPASLDSSFFCFEAARLGACQGQGAGFYAASGSPWQQMTPVHGGAVPFQSRLLEAATRRRPLPCASGPQPLSGHSFQLLCVYGTHVEEWLV